MAEAITIVSALNDLKERQPFEPFSIVMASGDRFQVVDSERILVFSTTVVLFPADPEGHVTLHLRQVSSVEVYVPRPQAGAATVPT